MRAKLRRYFRHGLLPQLIVFEAVARLGSVTRAAEELHLAQPTVSMQIKKLAATLEVALFEHRGRCLQLTAGGEALRVSCLEVFAAFHRIDDSLAGFRSYNSQPVVEDGEWRANTTRR
jgi:DNA-binding transcriptional LysR family regulator